MKRFLVCLVVVSFLVCGCAMGLQSIKPNTSPEKIISLVMEQVEKCDVDSQGWKILEIPDKAYTENHIKFVAYRHTEKDVWGVGVLEDSQGIAILLQHSKEQGWVAIQFGMPMPMEEAQALEFLCEWAALLAKNGDLSKAGTYKETPIEAPKANIENQSYHL